MGYGVAGQLADRARIMVFATRESDQDSGALQNRRIVEPGPEPIEVVGQILQCIEDDWHMRARELLRHAPGFIPAGYDRLHSLFLCITDDLEDVWRALNVERDPAA